MILSRVFASPWLVAALLALLVGGCAAQFPITRIAAPQEALIRVDDPLLRTARATRVHHLGAFEHVAYARFESDDLILEAVYDAALGSGLVLDYPYGMARMIETWNAHRGRVRSLSEKSTVRAQHGPMEVQPFRPADGGRSCAGFSAEWDFRPRDTVGRPGKVLFGYVCTKPGASISEARLATLLSAISVSGRPAESLRPVGARRQVDQAAVDAARGAGAAATGNADFPFNFGTTSRGGSEGN